MKVKFTKMHGTKNDYIYLIGEEFIDTDLIVSICDRHSGVGSDGVIFVLESNVADFKMRMFNSDGSEGDMCGNGIRCFAKFCIDNDLTNKINLEIETNAGIKSVNNLIVNMESYSLNINDYFKYENEVLIDEEILIDNKLYAMTYVNVGNPHIVIFVDDFDFNLELDGKLICDYFKGINVEFVKVIDKDNIKMRVYERGSGVTLSCGTGACASVVVSNLLDKTSKNVNVFVDGGVLNVRIDDCLYLSGDASFVCDGFYEYGGF